MENFDSTNYDDYLLSNFRNVKEKSEINEVEVEIASNDNPQINLNEKAAYDIVESDVRFIPAVKGECLQAKPIEGVRREPQTLAIVCKAIDKSKFAKNNSDIKTKRPKNYKIRRNFTLVVMTLIVGFIACLLIADAVSGGYIIESAIKGIFNSNTGTSYYAVEIASFNDVDSARITSEEIRASGGSGYVVHDQVYRVIAEVYSEEKQAESVSAKLNLAGYVTSVYQIKIGEINYSLFPISTRNITKAVMKYQEKMYQTLYEVAQKLENGEIDFATARVEVKTLKSEIKSMLVEYESNVDNEIDNKYIVKVRMQVNAMSGALDNICGDSVNNDRLLSDIRYINSTIINTHKALVNSLQ